MMNFVLQNEELCSKTRNFVLNMMNFAVTLTSLFKEVCDGYGA